ncbi:GGDEF domain-containing protein [Persephonella sp.]
MGTISKKILILVSVLIGLIAANNIFLFLMLNNIKKSSEVINLSGKIRGNIQRIVKLSVVGTPPDRLVDIIDYYVDSLIEKENYLSLPFSVNINEISRLENCWKDIKKNILKEKEIDKVKLIDISEKCWYLANEVTYRYQKLAQENVNYFIAIFSINGIVTFIVLGILIVIAEREVKGRLEFHANYDPLTKVLNRRSFIKVYNSIINREDIFPASLIVLDIDDFKRINDTYGHTVGDKVLKRFVDVIKKNIRKNDFFVRWGGEEFIIFFPKTDIKQAQLIAEKLRKLVENINFEEGFKVTVSIGLTEVKKGEFLVEVIKRADKALYIAKRNSKNRVEVGTD